MTFAPRQPAVLEEFEPRILYAADAAALGWALHDGIQQTVQQTLQATSHQGSTASTTTVRELVVLDLSLPDAQILLAGLQAQREAGRPIEIVTLDAGSDGIAAISAEPVRA